MSHCAFDCKTFKFMSLEEDAKCVLHAGLCHTYHHLIIAQLYLYAVSFLWLGDSHRSLVGQFSTYSAKQKLSPKIYFTKSRMKRNVTISSHTSVDCRILFLGTGINIWWQELCFTVRYRYRKLFILDVVKFRIGHIHELSLVYSFYFLDWTY